MSRCKPHSQGPGPYAMGPRPGNRHLHILHRIATARNNRGYPRESAATFSVQPVKPTATRHTCQVCARSHPRIRPRNCPALILIQQGKVMQPITCCVRCLGPLNQEGECRQTGHCHMITARSGIRYNFLCHTHKKVHFRICQACPPRHGLAPVAGQKAICQPPGITCSWDKKKDPSDIKPKVLPTVKKETGWSGQAGPPEEDPRQIAGDLVTPSLFESFRTCGLKISSYDIKGAFRQIARDIDSLLPDC